MITSGHPARSTIRFGPFEVDFKAGELRKQGIRVKLQDQPFQVLRILLEHPGEIVTREELRQRIWPADTFVDFDQGLNNGVKRLREALADSADNPEFIETVPRRGYRFVGIVSPPIAEASGTAPASSLPSPRPWTRPRIITAVLIGVVLVALSLAVALGVSRGWWQRWQVADGAHIRSIAVLPLRNLSADREQDYFADGLTDELITRLTKLKSLRVVSRTSVMHYKNTDETVPQIARDLGVDAVLEGSVLRSGEKVRISAQLILAATDRHLWADSYERDLRDIIGLQADLSSSIAQQIDSQLTPRERSSLQTAEVVSPEAYDAYLRGRFFLATHTESGMRQAIASFENAIRNDPAYSRSYSGLALGYQEMAYYVDPNRVLPKAKEAALSALHRNDCDADAHTALGWIKLHYDWDFPAAEAEYRQAIECDPGAAESHLEFATYLDVMGRFEEGLREHKIALERDPLSLDARIRYGDSFFYARRYSEAQAQYDEVLRLDPGFVDVHLALGWLYLVQGQSQAGISEMRKTMELDRGSGLLVAISYAISGNTAEARSALKQALSSSQTHYISGASVAFLYAAMRDQDNACKWLEKAYRDHDPAIVFFNVDPSNDFLRSSPCFREIVGRMNFR